MRNTPLIVLVLGFCMSIAGGVLATVAMLAWREREDLRRLQRSQYVAREVGAGG